MGAIADRLWKWWQWLWTKTAADDALPVDAVGFHDVLLEELDEVAKRRKQGVDGPLDGFSAKVFREEHDLNGTKPEREQALIDQKANRADLLGLAFSGGGVRSATFNLGVLQALARYDFLPRFDYLSTVSGGGYIGAWLTTWIRRVCMTDVNDGLSRSAVGKGSEPQQISYLRSFSSYLTPKSGLFSLDTWTVPAIYLRNVLLNLTVLVLGLSAVLLAPRLLVHLMSQMRDSMWLGIVVTGAVASAVVVTFIVANFRWAATTADPNTIRTKWHTSLPAVQLAIVLPLFVAAWCLVAAVKVVPEQHRATSAAGLVVLIAILAGVSAVFLILTNPGEGGLRRRLWAASKRVLCAVLASALGSWVLYRLAEYLHAGPSIPVATLQWLQPAQSLTTWGIPLANTIFSISALFYVGFMRDKMDTFQREWWGRLGGLVMMYSIAWAALCLISLGASKFVSAVGVWGQALIGSGWVLSTLSGLLLGRSSETGPKADRRMPGIVVKVAPYVFVVGFLVLLSVSVEWVGGLIQKEGWMTCAWTSNPQFLGLAIGTLAICAGLLSWRVDVNQFSMHDFYRNRLTRAYVGASNEKRQPHRFIGFDVDEHFVRISDMLFGPQPEWNQADCADKRLNRPNFKYPPKAGPCEAQPAGELPKKHRPPDYGGPYPIVNCALNLVAGKNLAWQKRKASSFVFTPNYSGYDTAIGRNQEDDTKVEETAKDQEATIETAVPAGASPAAGQPAPQAEPGFLKLPLIRIGQEIGAFLKPKLQPVGYRPTISYYGGLSYGTAMAISGAAASPNMGYHTSPALGFLMTVFNVRLGWWLGNPRSEYTWAMRGPGLGLFYLLVELFGLTNDERGFVYLSDGGHFDNLGIYELVHRKCRFIVACDAEEDGDLQFDGLGNAVEKCRTDFGVHIHINVDPIRLTKTDPAKGRHCAVGVIDYGPGFEKGTLLYIKATLTGNEPADVTRYKAQNAAFPHQSTADQWFDETQFESYRMLGQHIVEGVLDAVADRDKMQQLGIEEMFVRLRRHWYTPSQAISTSFTRHAEEFQRIMDELRGSPRLQFLDTQISPGLRKTAIAHPAKNNGTEPVNYGNWLPTKYTELRAGYYICVRMIQLMENVFLDLNLDLEHEHPDNQGWMNLFQCWSESGMFRVTWAIASSIYGARFRDFCRRRLHLDRGVVEKGDSIPIEVGDNDRVRFVDTLRARTDGVFGPAEALALKELVQAKQLLKKSMVIYPLVLSVKEPGGKGAVSGGIGFAVVDDSNQLIYLWIQEHLRSTGLARESLACLIDVPPPAEGTQGAAKGIQGIWVAAGEDRDGLPSNEDMKRIEDLFRSVKNDLQAKARRSNQPVVVDTSS
jgi:Patatin-like phospholipase